MSKTSKIIWMIAIIVLIVLIGVVGFGYIQKLTYKPENPIATMEVENFGTIKIELYPEEAPQTVSNFIALSNRGFYDGLTFHRIVKEFMIQGGDPEGKGTGGAKISNLKDDGEEKEYTIKGEFIANGVNNKIKMTEGVLAMARSDYSQYSSSLKEDSYNSGSSQFFIVTKDTNSLNGLYTGFGKVTEGMDIVHKIEEVEVKAADGTESSEQSQTAEVSTPVNPPKIKSIRVETNGVDYGLPNTLEPFNYNAWINQQYGIDADSLSSTAE